MDIPETAVIPKKDEEPLYYFNVWDEETEYKSDPREYCIYAGWIYKCMKGCAGRNPDEIRMFWQRIYWRRLIGYTAYYRLSPEQRKVIHKKARE